MNIVNLPQKSPEWIAWRRTKRMASFAPAVMGASRFQSRNDVVKFYRDGTSFAGNAATAYGDANEHHVRAFAADRIGDLLDPVCMESGEYAASLDGITDDGKIIAELKAPFKGRESKTYREATEGSAGGYAWQIQQQLFVSGADRCLYAVWVPDRPVAFWVSPDEALQASLRAAWDKLWVDVLAPVTRADADWCAAATAWIAAQQALKSAEAEEARARELLTGLATGKEQVGAGVRCMQVQRVGNVNYKAIPQLAGVDMEQYRGKGSSYYKLEVLKAERTLASRSA